MDNQEYMKSLADKINPNWYSISLISTLIFGILMLFHDELSSKIKDDFIPVLVVYILGTSLIGFIQGSYYRARFMNTGFKEPLWLYYTLHTIWFFFLISYLTLYKNLI